MAGHSKWNNIQVRKGRQDSRRAALFTKMARDIAAAAKDGGPDPAMNPRLKTMVEKARVASMPKDNIERAINRGAGIGESAGLATISYEGKGPGGIDVIVQVSTNNRNRAASEIKHIFTENGVAVGGPGSSSWNFEQKGLIRVKSKNQKGETEEELLGLIDIDGVLDIEEDEGEFEIYTISSDLMKVKKELEQVGYSIDKAELIMDPVATISLEGEVLDAAIAFLEELDDYADTDAVYTNLI